jgi:hypothetical protein
MKHTRISHWNTFMASERDQNQDQGLHDPMIPSIVLQDWHLQFWPHPEPREVGMTITAEFPAPFETEPLVTAAFNS